MVILSRALPFFRREKFWIFLTTLSLLYFPLDGQAQNSGQIIINEVAWMGTKINGVESNNWWRYEWIELFNKGTSAIDLSGWKLELYRSTLDWSLNLKGEVPAKGYFLIASSDKIPAFNQNYSNLKGYFNNSGEKVLLVTNNNTIADEINCTSGWFAGDNSTKQTMERIDPVGNGNKSNWGNSLSAGGTPGKENSIYKSPPDNATSNKKDAALTPPLVETETKTNYPGGIIFSEILPSPEGPDETDEWIEIFNKNSFSVDLSGWKITDAAGKQSAYVFPPETEISSNGFFVISRPETKITLNNDGDGLNLSQPNGTLTDSISYEKAPTGQSYALLSGSWQWSSSLTPGEPNKASPPPEEKNSSSTIKIMLAAQAKMPPSATLENKNILASAKSLVLAFILAMASGCLILLLKKKIVD